LVLPSCRQNEKRAPARGEPAPFEMRQWGGLELALSSARERGSVLEPPLGQSNKISFRSLKAFWRSLFNARVLSGISVECWQESGPHHLQPYVNLTLAPGRFNRVGLPNDGSSLLRPSGRWGRPTPLPPERVVPVLCPYHAEPPARVSLDRFARSVIMGRKILLRLVVCACLSGANLALAQDAGMPAPDATTPSTDAMPAPDTGSTPDDPATPTPPSDSGGDTGQQQ
jgi:hypothetical protein